MRDRIFVLCALADVAERSAIYAEAKGAVKAERLYHFQEGLDDFVPPYPILAIHRT